MAEGLQQLILKPDCDTIVINTFSLLKRIQFLPNEILIKMVQESATRTNAYSAVSRKDTGHVVDMSSRYLSLLPRIERWGRRVDRVYLWKWRRKNSQLGAKQQYDSSKSYSNQNKTDNSHKYGAWGPVYKDKNNFVNMHLFWALQSATKS